jgi:hypothetical protein
MRSLFVFYAKTAIKCGFFEAAWLLLKEVADSPAYRFILAPSGTSSLNRSIGSLATQAKPRSTTIRKIGSSNVQL